MRAQGYATLYDPDKGLKECDTHTCNHCNKIIHLPTNKHIEEVGDFCRACMRVICDRCAGHPCIPFLRKLEIWEARDRARASYV